MSTTLALLVSVNVVPVKFRVVALVLTLTPPCCMVKLPAPPPPPPEPPLVTYHLVPSQVYT